MWLLILVTALFVLHLFLRSPSKEPFVVGHRGAAGLAPENTLTAIRAGLDHAANYVEIDVRRSRDGVLVLSHDNNLRRTTNISGAIDQLTWKEIAMADAGSKFAENFFGEHVADFASALALVHSYPDAHLVIELKDPANYPGIEQQVLDAIQTQGMQGQVIVISFDQVSLERFHQLAPEIKIGLLEFWVNPFATGNSVLGQVTSVYWTNVFFDPTLLYRMHRQDRQLWVWTVDQPWLMSLLLWLGVDAITTNRPDLWPITQEVY